MTWLKSILARMLGKQILSGCMICAYQEYRYMARCPRCQSEMRVMELHSGRW